MSKIEWTERSWNPILGCAVVSPGCKNCYAMRTAHRLGRNPATPLYDGLTRVVNGKPVWTGEMRLAAHDVLTAPLRRRKPTTWFVNSMSDLFAEGVPDAWLDYVFAVMLLSPQHTFQVLTKRPERMRDYLTRPGTPEVKARHDAIQAAAARLAPERAPIHNLWFRDNIWLGVSAEDQQRFDERTAALFETSAFGPRFVSLEPLLSAIDLRFGWDHCDLCGGTGILARWPKGRCHVCNGKGQVRITGAPRRDSYRSLNWVIVGGESGPGARPMHPDWPREIRDQCAAFGVPFFFKQWGEWQGHLDRDKADPDWRADYGRMDREPFTWLNLAGGRGFHGDRFHVMQRVGKKVSGRLLDGRQHDGMPG